MELLLVRHLWGVELDRTAAFPKFVQEGFGAIECPLPGADQEKQFLADLRTNGLGYVAMAFTGGATVGEHVTSFRAQAERAQALGAMQLTCHSGSDAWNPRQAEDYFGKVLEIEKGLGLTVGHETHRGRLLFTPWQTRDLMGTFAALKLCCDYSHWVCVAERLLGDCGEILSEAAGRCVHIHARVGYEEGPQVPDPSAPEYAAQLKAHEGWWDAIWHKQRERGLKTSTLTPEFGPPGYLHTLPHTNVPVADLWKICTWMAHRQRERFGG